MNRFPVDAARIGGLTFLKADPKLDFDTKQQKLNADNVPQHTVSVVTLDEGAKPEVLQITVAAHTLPEVAPLTEVTFTDLVAMHWAQGNRSGIALSASGFESKNHTGFGKSLPNKQD